MGGLPSAAPDVFAYRYFNGKIDTSFKEIYEQADELLATLEGFGIDKDAFWYFILYIKDFVDGTINGAALSNTPKEDLAEIRDAFKDIPAKGFMPSQFLLDESLRQKKGTDKIIIKKGIHHIDVYPNNWT